MSFWGPQMQEALAWAHKIPGYPGDHLSPLEFAEWMNAKLCVKIPTNQDSELWADQWLRNAKILSDELCETTEYYNKHGYPES